MAALAATRALAVAMAADVGESFNIHVDNRSSNMKKLQLTIIAIAATTLIASGVAQARGQGGGGMGGGMSQTRHADSGMTGSMGGQGRGQGQMQGSAGGQGKGQGGASGTQTQSRTQLHDPSANPGAVAIRGRDRLNTSTAANN